MVYDRRPQRSSSYDDSSSSLSSRSSGSSGYYHRPAPETEAQRQQRLKREQEWRDRLISNGLPVFEIENIGEQITSENLQANLEPEKKGKKNQKQLPQESLPTTRSTTQESEKPELTKEEEEEEEEKKRMRPRADDRRKGTRTKKKKEKQKKNSWFPWLNRGRGEDKSNPKGGKPHRANNTNGQTENGKAPQGEKAPSLDSAQTTKTTSQPSTTPAAASEQSPSSQAKPKGLTPNQTQPKTEAPSIGSTPELAVPTNQPIFVSPDLSTARQLNSSFILGKTGNGEILYTSDNPAATKTQAVENGLSVSQLPADHSNALYNQQQAVANSAIGSVRTSASLAGESVTQYSSNSLTRLDGEIARINGAITNQIAQQQKLIAEFTQRNRTTVIAATETTIAQVQNKHAATITAIDRSAAGANEQLTAQYQSILPKIDSTLTEFDGRIDQTLGQTESFFDQQRSKWLTTIETTERGYIHRFNRQSPPESGNVIGKALEKIDRDSYVSNWREAKVKATQQVANSFRNSTNETFNQHTAKLADYRSTVMSGCRTLAQKRKQALTNQYQQAQNQINQTANTAKARANNTLNQSITAARQQQQQQLADIDAVANQQNQTLTQQGATATTTISELGNSLRNNLQVTTATASNNFNRSAVVFASSVTQGEDHTSMAKVPNAALSAQNKIAVLESQTINEIETAVAGSISQLQEQHSAIDSGLADTATSASSQQAAIAYSYQTTLQQLATEVNTGLDQQLQQTTQAIDSTAKNTAASWKDVADNLWDQYLGVNRNLSGKLTEAQNQVEAQKEQFTLKLGEQVRTNATREAALVQPMWKKVAKIVVNIVITVAVTIAVAALALSGVGIVAGIGLAALIGAAGGVAKLGISDAIDGKTSSAGDYLKAAGIGAATGVLEFAGASAVAGVAGKLTSGVLTKLEHTVVSTAVEAATNTTVELIETIASGQDVTLSLVGITVGSSLLSTVGGKYIDDAFGDIATSATRGASGEVGETVIEGVGEQAAKKGLGLNTAQFATETAFDTAVETGASVARGEELTWESMGENLAGGVLGRGAAGRADKLYGNRLRGIGRGNSDRANSSPLRDREARRVKRDRSNPKTNRTTNSDRTNSNSARTNSTDNSAPVNRGRNQTDSNTSLTPITSLQRNREFEQIASGGSSNSVEVYSDPELNGNTVRVEYQRADNGTITGVRMRAGAEATARDIELHQHTAKVMRMYGGTLGRVRVVEAKFAKWLGIHGQPTPGTRAWEAQQEVPKLEGIIEDRMSRLMDAEPSEAAKLEAEVQNLTNQLKEHRRTFERGDESQGVGYVAAEDNDLYKANHDTADNIRRRQDVQDKAETINSQRQINPQTGKQENPIIVPPELGYPAFVENERSGKVGSKRVWSSTKYQFDKTIITEMQGPGVKYNGYVKLGSASQYPKISRQTINKIKTETGYTDARIAIALNERIKGKPLPENLQKYEGRLDKLSFLIFGRESVRNPGNIVHAPMTLDLIASNKDPMTWEQALEGYEKDIFLDSTQQRLGNRGAFPMSMVDAQLSALYLEAQRKGEDPIEFLLEERWQRLPKEKQTSQVRDEERRKIVKKLRDKKIEQKAEELKTREIELTKRWLTTVGGLDASDLNLMDEKQATQIIERGTLDFYLNRRKNKRRKTR